MKACETCGSTPETIGERAKLQEDLKAAKERGQQLTDALKTLLSPDARESLKATKEGESPYWTHAQAVLDRENP